MRARVTVRVHVCRQYMVHVFVVLSMTTDQEALFYWPCLCPHPGGARGQDAREWLRPHDVAVHIFPKYNWGNLIYKVGRVSNSSSQQHMCDVLFRAGGGQINSGLLPYAADIDSTSKFFVEGWHAHAYTSIQNKIKQINK